MLLGPIVRINPYEIHINDPEMIDEVYPNQQKRSMKYGWAMKMFGLRTGHLATEDRKALFWVISSDSKLAFCGAGHVAGVYCLS